MKVRARRIAASYTRIARPYLLHDMLTLPSLLQNDLLRALNAIQSNGAHTLPGQPSFPAFLDYASRVCGVLELHLEGALRCLFWLVMH